MGSEPGALSLYWKTEDMAFTLGGNLAGPLDENTIDQTALALSGEWWLAGSDYTFAVSTA